MPESISELTPSVPAPIAPAPSEPAPTPPATPEPAPAPSPAAEPAAPVLYDLPDGRKVDADTLQREWKENFLPEFTRKSQALSEIEKNFNKPTNEPPKHPWESPDYVPGSYAELLDVAEKRTIDRIQRQAQEEAERTKALSTQVEQQLTSLKEKDPQLDENALFQHANKFGFRDLTSAHANMQAIRAAALDAEQRTLKNLKARGLDPISGQPSATAPDTGIDQNVTQQYGSALEFLSRITRK